ncbi:MAG TPA: hypothetical protein VG650_13420 [Mycobacteriales bacterium]|nr:hypothetical protein [Mycobacteriales bacterium]
MTGHRVGGGLVIDLRRYVDDQRWLDLGRECPCLSVPAGVRVVVLIGNAAGQTGVERIAPALDAARRVDVKGTDERGIAAVVRALRVRDAA